MQINKKIQMQEVMGFWAAEIEHSVANGSSRLCCVLGVCTGWPKSPRTLYLYF